MDPTQHLKRIRIWLNPDRSLKDFEVLDCRVLGEFQKDNPALVLPVDKFNPEILSAFLDEVTRVRNATEAETAARIKAAADQQAQELATRQAAKEKTIETMRKAAMTPKERKAAKAAQEPPTSAEEASGNINGDR